MCVSVRTYRNWLTPCWPRAPCSASGLFPASPRIATLYRLPIAATAPIIYSQVHLPHFICVINNNKSIYVLYSFADLVFSYFAKQTQYYKFVFIQQHNQNWLKMSVTEFHFPNSCRFMKSQTEVHLINMFHLHSLAVCSSLANTGPTIAPQITRFYKSARSVPRERPLPFAFHIDQFKRDNF